LLDGVIDVQTERLTLAVNTNDAYNDQDAEDGDQAINVDSLLVETTLETAVGNLVPAQNQFVITGNFGWMMDNDADEDGELSSAEILAGIAYTPFATMNNDADAVNFEAVDDAGDDTITAAELNDAMTELTLTGVATGGVVDAYHRINFVVPGATNGESVLLEQDFTVALTVSDGTTDTANDMVATAAVTAGEWALNGSVVNIPFMPFGPVTQPILRHTNIGVQTGDISARYMLETDGADENPSWVSLGVVVEDAQPGMVNLLGPVMEAAVADSGLTSGKMALEIITNVPAEDITVFSAAKFTTTDSDRLTVGAFQD
jgi:hypothetical protein